MIPEEAFDGWRRTVPWQSPHEIEQDLVLSRLIAEIAQHPVLGPALALKGGTCLHKLWLPDPWRYSEDLDYSISGKASLDTIKGTIVSVGRRVGFSGFTASTGRTAQPIHHTRLIGHFRDGSPMSVKFDIDPHAGEPALPYARQPFVVDSPWFQANTEVNCYSPAEMLASKVAALYGRRRHRDLYDIWAAIRAGVTTPREVSGCFYRYRPDGWTARLAANNLTKKLDRVDYATGLEETATQSRTPYALAENIQMAATLIDACAEATQPPKRWRRVVSSKGTASDILLAWIEQAQPGGSSATSRTAPSGGSGPTLRAKILAVHQAHPKAKAAQIAKSTGASRSYVNAVLRQTSDATRA